MFFSKFWLVGGKEWLTNGNALHPKWDVIGWNLSQFNLHYDNLENVCGQSKKSLDDLEVCLYDQESFQTIWKVSGRSKKCPDHLENVAGLSKILQNHL